MGDCCRQLTNCIGVVSLSASHLPLISKKCRNDRNLDVGQNRVPLPEQDVSLIPHPVTVGSDS